MRRIHPLLFAVALGMTLVSCKETDTPEVDLKLGAANPFNTDENLVTESDRNSVYYLDGVFYTVEDSIIKHTQYNAVVPRDITLLEYLKTYKDFKQESATITCVNMDGTECVVDLSTPWEECSFGELTAYWETSDSTGIFLAMCPDDVALVSEYLYYTDLTELFEDLTVGG